MESDGEKVMASLPSVGRGKLPARRKGLKVCSFHRLTQQRPEDRLACSLATRSLFMSFARLASKRGDLLGVVEQTFSPFRRAGSFRNSSH